MTAYSDEPVSGEPFWLSIPECEFLSLDFNPAQTPLSTQSPLGIQAAATLQPTGDSQQAAGPLQATGALQPNSSFFEAETDISKEDKVSN